jgi:hypothetical protein
MSPESILIIHVLIYILTYTILFLHFSILRNKGKSLQTKIYQVVLYSSWFPDTISMAIAIVLMVNEVDLRKRFHNDMNLINDHLIGSLTAKVSSSRCTVPMVTTNSKTVGLLLGRVWLLSNFILHQSGISGVLFTALYANKQTVLPPPHLPYCLCHLGNRNSRWPATSVSLLLTIQPELVGFPVLSILIKMSNNSHRTPSHNSHCPAIFQFEVFASIASAMILSDVASTKLCSSTSFEYTD